jgi:retron-type reverse transcriptase
MERRGGVVVRQSWVNHGRADLIMASLQKWEELMSEAKQRGTKPYCISQSEVLEAFERVKANKGAAGVDGQTIAEFEQDLHGNLYKIWNRMSSGSYFPHPVRRVMIPKAGGGSDHWGYQQWRTGLPRWW